MFEQRAAIIGTGFMGKTHAEALRRLGVEIGGVLGSSQDDGRQAAAAYGGKRAYADLDALLQDESIAVVHICTPNNLHHPMSAATLEAGKHVICEKPLATSAAEAGQLAELASSTGRVAAVNYNLRYYPLCQEARHRIAAGDIGDVRLVHGHYLQDWLLRREDWNWRVDPEQGGTSRAVADIGTHWFDLVAWLTGLSIRSLFADMQTVLPERLKPSEAGQTFSQSSDEDDAVEVPIETEDYATILLRMSNGAPGAVTVSQVSAGHKNQLSWEINGSEASLGWKQENPNELWIGQRDQPSQILPKDPALLAEEVSGMAAYPGGHAEGYPDTFVNHFRQVYSYLESGDLSLPRPFPTFQDGFREIQLTEAAIQSNREQRWIDLD